MAKLKPYWELDECGCCGAAINPCGNWPWHLKDDDCRAIRTPVSISPTRRAKKLSLDKSMSSDILKP